MKKTTAEQEVSLCYHTICFVLNYFAIAHDQNMKFVWFTYERYGGKWKYMSHIILYASTIYVSYAIVVDIISILTGYSGRPTDEDEPKVVQIRDRVFNNIISPFGIGHSLIFAFTTCLNHGFFVSVINRRKEDLKSYHMLFLHLFPLVFCILESALVYHKPSKKGEVKIPLALALLFNGWTLWVAYFGSYWSYPFLRRANTLVRALCIVLLPIIIIGCHFLGGKMTKYFWELDTTAAETEVGEKKKKD